MWLPLGNLCLQRIKWYDSYASLGTEDTIFNACLCCSMVT